MFRLKQFYSSKRKQKQNKLQKESNIIHNNKVNIENDDNNAVILNEVEEIAIHETIGLVKHIGVFEPKIDLPPPDDLICEECENSIASKYCELCDEIYCSKCCLLCHQRTNFGINKHPHEEKGIRDLIHGDTSKIKRKKSFIIPENEIQIEELMKLQDLSIPNSLESTIQHKIDKTINVYDKFNKYKVHDIVVFNNILTNEESYGIIISQWDYRHGDVAPPIIRNDKSIVSYIIRIINPISAIGTISDLIEYLDNIYYNRNITKEIVTVSGLEYQSNKEITEKIYEISNKLEELNQIKLYGPQFHFTFHNITKLQTINDKNNLINDDISIEESNKPLTITISSSNNNNTKYYSSNKDNDNDDDDCNDTNKIPILKDLPDHMKGSNNKNYQQYVLYNNKIIPMKSNQRKYMHSIGFSEYNVNMNQTDGIKMKMKNEKNMPGNILEISENVTKEAINIVILSENEILYPKEKLLLLQQSKYIKMANTLHKRNLIIEYKRKRKGFSLWVSYMLLLRKIEADVCATVIQSSFRRWRCRYVIDELYKEWRIELKQRWQRLHDQFNYCSESEPGSVTLDGKIYFRKLADANRYGNTLIISVNRIIKYLNRKKLKYLSIYFMVWYHTIQKFIEILKMSNNSHFDEKLIFVEDTYNDDSNNDFIRKQQDQAQDMYRQFKLSYNKSINTIDDESVRVLPLAIHRENQDMDLSNDISNNMKVNNINNISPRNINSYIANSLSGTPLNSSRRNMSPMSLTRRLSTNSNKSSSNLSNKIYNLITTSNDSMNLPPYNPHDKMTLPPINFIKMSNSYIDRLVLTNDQYRLQEQYKSHMKGVTNYSCWIIPGRLSIGQIPHLSARVGSSMMSTTALLLSGINVFISLMTEEEESKYNCDIKDLIRKGKERALYQINTTINSLQNKINQQNYILNNLPKYEISKEDYKNTEGERLRGNARILLYTDNINKSTSQRDILLTTNQWLRCPIVKDTAPSITLILPIIWDIEDILSKNKNVYLYSDEGHGRVGMIASILLGRLYGLTAIDALYHVQLSHDTYKSQEKSDVKITCPQLVSQKQIVIDVINHSNHIYEGIHWRSSINPEANQIETQYIKRGTTNETLLQLYNDPTIPIDKQSIVFSDEDRVFKNSYLTWSDKRAKFASPKSRGVRQSFSTKSDSASSLNLHPISLALSSRSILSNIPNENHTVIDEIDENEVSKHSTAQRQPIAKRAMLPLIRNIKKSG